MYHQREMSKDYVINPDRLKNFFNELDTRRTLLTTVTDLNNKLLNHFFCLEETLNKKSVALDTQIQKLKENTQKAIESLENRENGIPEREVTLAARVQQVKDSCITDIKSGKETTSDLLRMWFRRMDAKGLIKYLSENRKESGKLRVAGDEAVDLLGFVLEAVEEFVMMKISGKKIGGLRYACGILIQAVFPIPFSDIGGVSTSLKERAAAVLHKWTVVLSGHGDGDGDGVSKGEAIMFLTLVIGFGLKGNFDDGFFKSLVLEVGSKRDMAKLAVALLSGDNIRVLIEELVKTGKEVEAVYIASEAALTHLFSPVQLLKTCLSSCHKTTSNDAPSREDVKKEVITTRVIIKCIEDHKLESEFSMSTLKKRINQLEKLKTDKKKKTDSDGATKPPSNKRSRPHPHRHTRRPPKMSRVSKSSYGYTRPSVYENRLTTEPVYGGVHIHTPTQSQSHAGYPQYANHVTQDIGASGGSYYDYNGLAVPSQPTATYNL